MLKKKLGSSFSVYASLSKYENKSLNNTYYYQEEIV